MASDLEQLISGLKGSDLPALAQALQAMARPEADQSDLRDLVNSLDGLQEGQIIAIRKVGDVYELDTVSAYAPQPEPEPNVPAPTPVPTPSAGSGTGHVYTHPTLPPVPGAHYPYVDLVLAPADPQYGIIHVPKQHKGFFPGYNVQFVLDALGTDYVLHLTGALNTTQRGAQEGGYLGRPHPTRIDQNLGQQVPTSLDIRVGCFKRFYENNPNVMGRDTLRIECVHPQLYRIVLHVPNPDDLERVPMPEENGSNGQGNTDGQGNNLAYLSY